MSLLELGLMVTGMGTIALGAVHLVIPRLVDIERAVPPLRAPLRPLPVLGRRYDTRRADVLGVVWVSNNAASYALITLGAADLLATIWLGTDGGRLIAGWATGWWIVRAISQLAFGRRPVDVAVMGIFLVASAIHAAAIAA